MKTIILKNKTKTNEWLTMLDVFQTSFYSRKQVNVYKHMDAYNISVTGFGSYPLHL